MFPLDREILLLINRLAGSSVPVFEAALFLCGAFPLVACVATLVALWWTDAQSRGGPFVIGGGFGSMSQALRLSRRRCVAVALAIAGAFVCTRFAGFLADLPRPLAGEDLTIPIDAARFRELSAGMIGFGAFPSDHAALFFALAVGLFAWSRALGTIGLAAATTLSLARVAVGFHYPSDVVVGGAIGAFAAWGCLELQRRSPGFFDLVVRTFDDHPAWTYPALFVVALDFTSHFKLVFGAVFYLVPRLLGG
jgi:undecaprenyl-diphosphatase